MIWSKIGEISWKIPLESLTWQECRQLGWFCRSRSGQEGRKGSQLEPSWKDHREPEIRISISTACPIKLVGQEGHPTGKLPGANLSLKSWKKIYRTLNFPSIAICKYLVLTVAGLSTIHRQGHSLAITRHSRIWSQTHFWRKILICRLWTLTKIQGLWGKVFIRRFPIHCCYLPCSLSKIVVAPHHYVSCSLLNICGAQHVSWRRHSLEHIR